MPRHRRRRRSLGAAGLQSHGEKVCATHYRGDARATAVCQAAVRGMVSKMVREKPKICKKWCGCPR